MYKDKVYISVSKKASIDTELDVLVRDLGEVFCTNAKLRLAISNILIKKKNKEEDWDNITAIHIAEKVLGKYPDIELDLLGEPEILLEYKSQQIKRPFLGFIKIALVCIILFFGAGLAITNFHEDVNTKASMGKLYFTLTGEKEENPLIMNIPYSIGIGVGVITFFNRVLSQSKRRKMEPGPMEIELYLYDQDMEAQISNEVKKIKRHKIRGEVMVRNLFSILAAFGGGITVGGAAAAFITILQIIPRLVQVSETSHCIKTYQLVVITSFILFTIIYFSDFHLNLSKYVTIPIGIIFGIFVGLLSSALAEVLNVIPVLSKKLKIKDNLKYVIWTLVVGKVAGSLYFWLYVK